MYPVPGGVDLSARVSAQNPGCVFMSLFKEGTHAAQPKLPNHMHLATIASQCFVILAPMCNKPLPMMVAISSAFRARRFFMAAKSRCRATRHLPPLQ